MAKALISCNRSAYAKRITDRRRAAGLTLLLSTLGQNRTAVSQRTRDDVMSAVFAKRCLPMTVLPLPRAIIGECVSLVWMMAVVSWM